MKKLKQKYFLLSVLASCISLSIHNAYALQQMNDNDLRAIDGQDGIIAEMSYDSVNVDQIYWQDQTGSSTTANTQNTLMSSLTGVSIKTANANNPNVTIKANTGSSIDGSQTGIDFDLTANLGTIQIDKMTLCQGSDSVSTCQGNPSFGKISIQNALNTPIKLHLTTSNGLFSRTGFTTIEMGIKGLDIGINQKQSDSIYNALILKNFNFNFDAKGYMYVDPAEGLILRTNPALGSGASNIGYVDFKRDANNKPGLNLEFVVQPNAQQVDSSLGNGVIRAGANGRMINGVLQFRGTQDSTSTILGATQVGNSIAGNTGIAFRLNGEFTNDRDNLAAGIEATSLELGSAGNRAYGLRFQNITPLQTRKGVSGTETTANIALNSDHAGLEMQGIYFNLVNANNIYLPQNSSLLATTFGQTGTQLVTAADFIQTLSSNNTPYTVLAIREMNFAALSRRGQFIYTNENGVVNPVSTTTKWGLGLPIYNFNANFAFSPRMTNGKTTGDYVVGYNNGVITKTEISGSERIGFSGSMSTQGVSADGSKTTSILLVDGGDNPNDSNRPTDYYVGLRNINMLLNGTGSLGFENGKINASLPKLLMVMSAQLAAGYLPGAKYKTCPTNGGCYAPSNSFINNNDVLAGIKLRLAGSANFSILPMVLQQSDFDENGRPKDGKNALNFIGLFDMDATQNNAIQIVDPVDGSTMGLDNMSGSLAFDNKIIVNKDNIGFNMGFTFNPQNNPNDVFRVKNVNFYPSVNGTVGAPQRLGELAITGGRLTSELRITPRDGAF